MLDIERELTLLAEHKIDFVIIGGIAARAHGSSHETNDLDVCYARDRENLNRLAASLGSVHATLRGAPKDIPFRLDAETLHRGLEAILEYQRIREVVAGEKGTDDDTKSDNEN